MSRSVKIVESVNGRESLGGGSLFLGWVKTDARGSWIVGRRQRTVQSLPEASAKCLCPTIQLPRADGEKTDPEREGVGDFLVDLSESEIRGIMTE